MELILDGICPTLTLATRSVPADRIFKGLLDLTNALVLLTIVYAFVRWLRKRQPFIELSLDASLILGLIATLRLTHFMHHGLALAAEANVSARFGSLPISPAGYGASYAFTTVMPCEFSADSETLTHASA